MITWEARKEETLSTTLSCLLKGQQRHDTHWWEEKRIVIWNPRHGLFRWLKRPMKQFLCVAPPLRTLPTLTWVDKVPLSESCGFLTYRVQNLNEDIVSPILWVSHTGFELKSYRVSYTGFELKSYRSDIVGDFGEWAPHSLKQITGNVDGWRFQRNPGYESTLIYCSPSDVKTQLKTSLQKGGTFGGRDLPMNVRREAEIFTLLPLLQYEPGMSSKDSDIGSPTREAVLGVFGNGI